MAARFTKLTRAAIKALAPGKSIEEHGIRVERTKSNDLRFVIAAMIDGRRISRSMGMECQSASKKDPLSACKRDPLRRAA